jgi:hypothetical protein
MCSSTLFAYVNKLNQKHLNSKFRWNLLHPVLRLRMRGAFSPLHSMSGHSIILRWKIDSVSDDSWVTGEAPSDHWSCNNALILGLFNDCIGYSAFNCVKDVEKGRHASIYGTIPTWSRLTCLLTHGVEPFLRSRQLYSNSRTSQDLMEPECSISCSQEPSTGPYPEPYQANPHHLILSL